MDMKFNIKIPILLFILILVGSCSIASSSFVLFSFEDEQEFSNWKKEKGAAFEMSDLFPTHGNYSLFFSVDKDAGYKWPSIYRNLPSTMRDWSSYTHLAFDFYNPMDVEVPLRLQMKDRSDKVWKSPESTKCNVGIGTFTVPLSNIQLDLSDVRRITFYFAEPTDNFQIYIDNIRLLRIPNSPKNIVARRVEDTNQVSIEWQAADPSEEEGKRAVGYRIYRSTSVPGDGNYEFLGETAETPWVDIGTDIHARYWYTVVSVNSFGDESEISEWLLVEKYNVITSFEFGEGGTKRETTAGVYIEITQDYVTDGENALLFRIDSGSGQQCPTITLYDLSIKDWTRYSGIAFDYYNPMEVELPLCLEIRTEGGNWSLPESTKLPPGEDSLVVSFQGINVDFENVTEILFYFSDPTMGYEIYIDNVRLLDDTPPLPPEEIKAKRINGTPKVEIEWEAPSPASDGDLPIFYRIYRGIDSEFVPEEPIVEVGGTITSCSWIDENAPTSKTYYIVTSVDKENNEGIPEPISVEAVGSISGRVFGDGELVAGASIYVEELDKTYETDTGVFSINNLTAGRYKLIARGPGYRATIPVMYELDEGEHLELDDIHLERDTTPPNAPRDLSADPSLYYGVIVLQWIEPEKAGDEEELDVEYYNIYRSTNPELGKNKELIGTTTLKTWSDVLDERFFDKELYYAVEAVDFAGNISVQLSNVASAIVVAPPIPTIIAPINRELILDTVPILMWDGSEVEHEGDFVGYEIQVSTDNRFPANKVNIYRVGPGSEEYELEESLSQGTWYWRIRARFSTNVTGKEICSRWSQIGEFVVASAFDSTHLVPYINIYPNVLETEPVMINYLLTSNARVTLRIFNLGGKLVSNILTNEVQIPGEHSYLFPGLDSAGRELFNGLYFVQLIAEPIEKDGPGKVSKSRKIVIYRKK